MKRKYMAYFFSLSLATAIESFKTCHQSALHVQSKPSDLVHLSEVYF